MANHPHFAPSADALDIVFAHRNKAYGAYQLRRAYAKNLRRALGYALLVIGGFLALPHILSALGGDAPPPPPEQTIFSMTLPDVDPNSPPPPPPPPPPTPPPPVHASIQFVPPIQEQDSKVSEEPPVVAPNDITVQVAATTQEGPTDVPPPDFTPPKPAVIVDASPETPDVVWDMGGVQKPPTFPGGEKEMLHYLAEQINYPSLARENNIQGNVVLSFVVGKDGLVSDIEVLKDIGGGCGKESIRVVQSMPRWSAGEANGKPVKVKFTLPVRFRLE